MGTLPFDIAIKGTLVLAVTAGLVLALLRQSSAAARHLAWSAGLACTVALPILSALLPRWGLEILPPDTIRAASAVSTHGSADSALVTGSHQTWLLAAWLVGAMLVATAIAIGRARVWWIARSSEALNHGPWPALVNTLCGEIDLARRVTVRQTDRAIMPMMWGLVRPVILLPDDADQWPESVRRDVLLHELAHVKRHDYLTQLVGRAACTLHWFNPLAWLAVRRLRVERERACDDHVLETGASPCDYAEHLLAVARTRAPLKGALGLGMSGASPFAERLAALLDGRRRRGVLSRRLTLPTVVAAAGIVIPLAAVDPQARPSSAVVRAATDAEPAPYILAPPPSSNVERPVRADFKRRTRREAPLPRAERSRREATPARGPVTRPSPPVAPPAPAPVATRSAAVVVPRIEVVIERPGEASDILLVADIALKRASGRYTAGERSTGKKAGDHTTATAEGDDGETCSEKGADSGPEVEEIREGQEFPARIAIGAQDVYTP